MTRAGLYRSALLCRVLAASFSRDLAGRKVLVLVHLLAESASRWMQRGNFPTAGRALGEYRVNNNCHFYCLAVLVTMESQYC